LALLIIHAAPQKPRIKMKNARSEGRSSTCHRGPRIAFFDVFCGKNVIATSFLRGFPLFQQSFQQVSGGLRDVRTYSPARGDNQQPGVELCKKSRRRTCKDLSGVPDRYGSEQEGKGAVICIKVGVDLP
jgi:hypothetical protein